VFPEFYKKLNANYRLSKTDFRLIAYIKMNKSNNEIAQISGISIRTIQSQRYRLSKKLKLEKNQDLNSFIFEV
ncbi:LuxR C-terminal-related transcriptional regulator, partial [Flavobacteriaceae bacterium]|nr:LuxR C-terminal-related transcriptional regulator [Flavobacteriaceae bacterium]